MTPIQQKLADKLLELAMGRQPVFTFRLMNDVFLTSASLHHPDYPESDENLMRIAFDQPYWCNKDMMYGFCFMKDRWTIYELNGLLMPSKEADFHKDQP